MRRSEGSIATELLIVALTGLVGLGSLALLQSRTVRAAALRQVERVAAERLGVAFRADDFRWEAREDRLVLERPSLGVPQAQAAFTAERMTIEVRLSEALLGDTLRLRSVDIEGPVVDLAAPLPTFGSRSSSDEPERPLSIQRFRVTNGRVRGAPADDLTWSIDGLQASGSLSGGDLSVALASADVKASGQGLDVAVRAEGGLRGPVAGPWSIGKLALRGEGLDAELSGVVGVEDGQPLRVEWRATARPGALLAAAADSLPASGRIESEGELDWSRRSARVKWNAEALSGTLLAALVEALPEPLRGLYLDTEGDLQLGPGDLTRAVGQVSARVGAGDASIASLTARPSIAPSDAELRVPVEVALLPDDSGTRRVTGTLRLPTAGDDLASWLERIPGVAAWSEGRIDIDERNLALRVRRLTEAVPQLAWPADAPVPEGALRLTGTFSGPLLDPAVELRGSASARELTLSLALRGRPAAGLGRVDVEAPRMDLPLPGLEQVRGTVSARLWAERMEGGALRGEARVSAPELELLSGGEAGRRLSGVELAVDLTGGRVRIGRLAAASGPLAVSGSGAITLADPLKPLPIAQGRLDLELEHEDSPYDSVPLSLTLERGVLQLQAERLGARGEGFVEATIPLRSLEPLVGRPALSWATRASQPGPVVASWRLPEADWTSLARALGAPDSLEEAHGGLEGQASLDLERPLAATARVVLSDGRARVAGRRVEVEGPVSARLEGGELHLDLLQVAAQPAAGESGALETLTLRGEAQVDSAWRLSDPIEGAVRDLHLDGTADLPASLLLGLLPAGAQPAADGRVSMFFEVSGAPRSLEAELWLEGPEASWRLQEPELEVRSPVVSASLAGSRLELDRFEVTANGESIGAVGWVEVSPDRVEAALETVQLGDCSGSLEGSLPRALLASSTEGSRTEGLVSARLRFVPCDWTAILSAAGAAAGASVRAGLTGSVVFDAARPAAGSGELQVEELSLDASGRSVRAVAPLRLGWTEGGVVLEPFELQVEGQGLTAFGRAQLDPGWTRASPFEDLVRDVEVVVHGRVLADLLRPFLGGGRAEGAFDLRLDLRGPPRELTGRIRVDGAEASVAILSPYFTRVVAPQVEAELRQGALHIRRGSMTLNEGPVEFSGEIDLDGAVDLAVSFDQVRYRLDYGLLAFLGGNLRWTGDLQGESLISGGVSLDRGILTRPIELDREFLVSLLSPVDLSGSTGGWLEQVRLDLVVPTGEGVRVRNNLADLLVRWEPLHIGGTLAFPLIEGSLEVDPGGVVRVADRVIRLERAALTYSGEPGAEPVLDLVTTDSAADPSIEVLARQGAATPQGSLDVNALGEGVATFLGAPIVGRLGEALGGTQIQVQGRPPIAVFGEADPSARLNVTRDFSAQVAVVASVDLRSAENQTYILDLHDLRGLPSLSAQAFTLDDGEEGATLQQSLDLGGGGREAVGPRIRRLDVDRPPGVSRRGLRRAIGVGKGDPLPPGGVFAIEVEVLEYLRRRGFPEAIVEVTESRPDEGVVLDVGIEAGPRVAFRFEGDRPPRRLRESITVLFRPEPFEEPTLELLRDQSVRVFRSRGHLEPQVDVEARPATESEGSFDRVVTVTTLAGPRVELSELGFVGVPEEESSWIARRFWGPVQRAELALGLPEAEERALQAMRDLGYLEPVFLEREMSEDGLTVRVGAAGRRRVARVETSGLPEGLDVEPILTVGDPLRSDWIGASVLDYERALRAHGYPDASVQARIVSLPIDPVESIVRFEADPGDVVELGAIRVEGTRATREKWARAVADVPQGGLLVEEELQAARRRLYGTGLFSRVSYRLDRTGEGPADVTLEVEERPRFRIAYGVRWESEDGTSALVEAEDRNFLGRNLDLAVRGLWAGEDYSVRGLFGVPRLFGTNGSLELFALSSHVVDGGLIRDRAELTLQVGFPLSTLFTGRAYMRYRDDEIREEEPDPFFPIMERIKSPLLGLQLLYEDRLDRTHPEDGFFGSIDLSGADDRIGGDFRYLRLYAQLHWYRPTGRFRSWPIVWAQSYRFGVAEPLDDQELIFQNRFFAGGEYSVRGYDRDSLGPQEQLGSITRPAGGEALMVLNQELRVRFSEALTGLVFADFGNVWSDKADFGSDLVTSLGIGVRAITPLGLLRLDVAHPLDRRPEDSQWRLHFGLGNAF